MRKTKTLILMKTTKQILGLTFVALLSAAGGIAQTTTTPPTGTPAGSAATGTTNSGGVAPATGKPSETPTGPTAGGTGSGTTPPTPTTGTSSGTTTTTTTTGTTTTSTTPTTTTTPPAGPGKASPHTPNENASDTAKAVQGVLLKFEAKRDQAIAERKALIDKLQAAKTDAERQAIITQLRTETQAQKDEQAAMGKEIREELKKLRDQRKTGGS